MEKEKIKDTLSSLIVLVVIGYTVSFVYEGCSRDSNLKQRDKTVITIAHIEDCEIDYKLRHKFFFWYMVGSERKEAQSAEIGFKNSFKPLLIGKTIPMVYLKNDPEKRRLLISEKDFEMTNLPYPDSMHWTKEYESW